MNMLLEKLTQEKATSMRVRVIAENFILTSSKFLVGLDIAEATSEWSFKSTQILVVVTQVGSGVGREKKQKKETQRRDDSIYVYSEPLRISTFYSIITLDLRADVVWLAAPPTALLHGSAAL